jgi:hypothetical protein
MPLTLEQRRAGGIRSGEVRRQQATELANLRSLPLLPQPKPPEQTDKDAVSIRIARAIDLTLEQLLDPDTPAKDRQALATSLRSLRETYHMVTGDALPGRLKPSQDRRAPRPAPAQPIG